MVLSVLYQELLYLRLFLNHCFCAVYFFLILFWLKCTVVIILLDSLATKYNIKDGFLLLGGCFFLKGLESVLLLV